MTLRPNATAYRTEAGGRPGGVVVSPQAQHSGQRCEALAALPSAYLHDATPISSRGASRVGSAWRSRIRVLLVLLVGVAMVMSVSSCALAARLLATVEVVSAIQDMGDSPEVAATSPVVATGGADVRAVVAGTGGSGLRLQGRPGADRLSVFPDGTVVTVECQATGPSIASRNGESAIWSRVLTPAGSTGFMSDAYLRFESDPAAVPPCSD